MILYEDKELIVCHKPAGVPVQSARLGQKDMVSILNNYLAEKRMQNKNTARNQKGVQPEMVYVVHRLDQPVEGVIVFAKTKKAAAALGRQITQNSVQKIYRAVCCVTEIAEKKSLCAEPVTDDSGADKKMQERYTLSDYLVKDGRTNTSRIARKEEKDAKAAELSFTVLDRKQTDGNTYLLAEIELKTGRHHQIRVQMAHAGLPLYGDRKYCENWQQYAKEARPEPALCAVKLSFNHPSNGKRMTFEVKPEKEAFRMFEA